MASIAYISDEKMIEFHRLHGHDEINFWRLSTRKFSDFSINDFLFFLVKTHRKEKGIVGFGKLAYSENLSVNQMFKKYGKKNGYKDYESLRQAIEQANKQDVFPRKCNCLYLKNVVFFEAPVFLSEFGLQISTSLESFTYIDQHKDVTSELLKGASEVGRDIWIDKTTKQNPIDFEQEILLHQVAEFSKQFGLFKRQKEVRLAKKLVHDKLLPLASNPGILYQDETLYIPLLNTKEALLIYGFVVALKEAFEPLKKYTITVYTDKSLDALYLNLFESRGVSVVHTQELLETSDSTDYK